MAKRIRTKKELIKKRNAIIENVKDAYNQVRKINPKLPGFYTTKAYKDLDKKRRRSLRRYDKREEINEARRENEATKKALPKEFDTVQDMSVYEAYNGKGRIFEESLIQKHKDGFAFKGIVEYKKTTNYFSNYADFRRDTNRIIKIIYALIILKGSDELFKWRVTRRYSTKESAVLISYTFYRVDKDEDEEESEG